MFACLSEQRLEVQRQLKTVWRWNRLGNTIA
jgi:hypothetical protein